MVVVIQKPIAFEAVLARDLMVLPRDDWSGVPNALHLAYKRGRIHFLPGAIDIESMSGRRIRAEAADWLLCSENGDVFAVSQEVFVDRYEASPKSSGDATKSEVLEGITLISSLKQRIVQSILDSRPMPL